MDDSNNSYHISSALPKDQKLNYMFFICYLYILILKKKIVE